MTVAPIEEQADPFESRRVWEKVAKGIRTGDFEMASREKSRVENEQRQRRKDEAAKGEKWQLKHFVRVESDPDCKCSYFISPSLCLIVDAPPPFFFLAYRRKAWADVQCHTSDGRYLRFPRKRSS